jgi:hypothetical protein
VHFGNGKEKEFTSNVLKVESALASLPPDMPLRKNRALEAVEGDPDLPDAEKQKIFLLLVQKKKM